MARLGHRAAILPLRARGILLAVAGAYVAWRIGKQQADYLLYPAGICAIALVGLCIVCVAAGALRVWLAVRQMAAGIPADLETTQSVPTGFRFPRLTWWPLVETRMTWEAPAGVSVSLEARGGAWSADEEEAFKAPIREQYEAQGHPYFASARLWDDGVIDPADTRRVLALGLSASLNAPIPDAKFGVFRM